MEKDKEELTNHRDKLIKQKEYFDNRTELNQQTYSYNNSVNNNNQSQHAYTPSNHHVK